MNFAIQNKKLDKKPENIFDIIITGGGIVGMATAWKIQSAWPQLSILCLEKENILTDHQTGHNSGVIHSGIYYKPGSAKARTCVSGRKELVAFAKTYNIAHDVCGKIVVATEEREIPLLEKVYQRALENQVEDVSKISAERIREIEPNCVGIAGLWVGCTGIIDYRAVTNKLAELVIKINPKSKILTGHEVTGLKEKGTLKEVLTSNGNFIGKHLIFCGGLHSDRLAKMDGGKNLGMRIVGFRGDYFDLAPHSKNKIKNLIYPVPDPAFPFLGVHFTRMTDGSVECGPNAVFTFKREGYGKLDFNLLDSWDALTYKGTWKLFFKHWRFGLDEYRRAFSKKLFLNKLRKLIPTLQMSDLVPGRSGVRAMALDGNGEMIDDFRIEYMENSIHVLNAPSPAATACLAIGDEVRIMAEQHFKLG